MGGAPLGCSVCLFWLEGPVYVGEKVVYVRA